MGFDWAADNYYLASALDKAENRAYKAELDADAQKRGLHNIMHTAGKTAVGMGVAGGLAYYAASTGAMAEPLKGLGIPLTLDGILGFGGKLAVLFSNKLKIPQEAVGYLDAASQGALDHWAVVAGQRAGLAAKKASDKGTGGTGSGAGTKGVPQVGATYRPTPAAMPAHHAGHNPTDYMTPAQKAVWADYVR